MADFKQRVSERAAIAKEPNLWFWTPAFEQVIAWLHHKLHSGATIFEVGCGLGFVLHELRRKGFNVAGLDVAELAVSLNRRDGFQIWHGELSTLPVDWIRPPDAVVAFFMLHHLEDPLSVLLEVRRRWPAALVAIAQYGKSSPRDIPSSLPPRTLSRWGVQPLRMLLLRAGYSPTVSSIPSTGVEHRIFHPLGRSLKWTMAFPLVYRMARKVQRVVLPRLAKRFQVEDFVVVALGEPV